MELYQPLHLFAFSVACEKYTTCLLSFQIHNILHSFFWLQLQNFEILLLCYSFRSSRLILSYYIAVAYFSHEQLAKNIQDSVSSDEAYL